MSDLAGQPRGDAELAEPGRFTAFYAEALPRVYGYFLHRCAGETALAEDLTQETFLAAVAEIRRGAVVAAPIPWILGIARHKLIDQFRRQRRSGWTLVPWDEEDDRSEQPVLLGDGPVAYERAVQALAMVAASQREALVLRYLDGMSVAEVAEATGRSQASIESLLSRGRAGFRRAYLEATDE